MHVFVHFFFSLHVGCPIQVEHYPLCDFMMTIFVNELLRHLPHTPDDLLHCAHVPKTVVVTSSKKL